MTRNPFQIALIAYGAFALVLAFMLYLVVNELTDFTSYDVHLVAQVDGWSMVSAGSGIAALIGSVVLAGVHWALRHPSPDTAGENPASERAPIS